MAAAIEAFRARIGWDGAPVRITVTKRIPVAGGMAGGSADAAATLRLLAAHAGTGGDALEELATRLGGADVPSQIRGGRVLATGAGAAGAGYWAAPTASSSCRSTLRCPRRGLRRLTGACCAPWPSSRRPASGCAPTTSWRAVGENDLQRPARILCPAIDGALADAAAAGADEILVSGSGPTVLGLFAGEGGAGERARVAAAELAGRRPGAIAAEPACGPGNGGRERRASH